MHKPEALTHQPRTDSGLDSPSGFEIPASSSPLLLVVGSSESTSLAYSLSSLALFFSKSEHGFMIAVPIQGFGAFCLKSTTERQSTIRKGKENKNPKWRNSIQNRPNINHTKVLKISNTVKRAHVSQKNGICFRLFSHCIKVLTKFNAVSWFSLHCWHLNKR